MIFQPHHAWSDDRKYRLITLRSNGLKVLLIHDRETEKGSASMSVHVGHFSDPDDRPGLAHFCEHMLFLGTEKYPEEAEYKRYLAEYGGRSNASTSTEGTTFQFDVVADHLEGALDRFSQFFTAPLFTESCTSRKSTPSIQNFNSSTMMMGEECGSFSRACRRAEILEWAPRPRPPKVARITRSQNSPAATRRRSMRPTPASGSFNSTMTTIRATRCAWSSSENSLDELEDWVADKFSNIRAPSAGRRNQEARARLASTGDPWLMYPKVTPKALEKNEINAFRVLPVKDIRKFYMLWPSSGMHMHHISTRPHRYLSHILGHEGKGSVLSLLKKLGLANGLSAGMYVDCSSVGLFRVSVDLTEAGDTTHGIQRIASIIAAMMQKISEAGARKSIFDEMAAVSEATFNYQSKVPPYSATTRYSKRMLHLCGAGAGSFPCSETARETNLSSATGLPDCGLTPAPSPPP